jgi:hypothetical protein
MKSEPSAGSAPTSGIGRNNSSPSRITSPGFSCHRFSKYATSPVSGTAGAAAGAARAIIAVTARLPTARCSPTIAAGVNGPAGSAAGRRAGAASGSLVCRYASRCRTRASLLRGGRGCTERIPWL